MAARSRSSDNASSALSVGHLILALRWCYQQSLTQQNKQDSDNNIQSLVSAPVQRLAEQLVILLGAELSLHAELKSENHLSSKVKATLDMQIYNLFADPSVRGREDENTEGFPLVPMTTGKLRGIISDVAWSTVRPQVQSAIERAHQAKTEKERRRREKRSYSNDYSSSSSFGASGRYRSSNQKSAFRGLGY